MGSSSNLRESQDYPVPPWCQSWQNRLLLLFLSLSWLSVSSHGKVATVTDRPGRGCCSLESAVGLSWWVRSGLGHWPGPLKTCQHPTVWAPRAATISSEHSQKEMDYNHSGVKIHLYNLVMVPRCCVSARCLYRWVWNLAGLLITVKWNLFVSERKTSWGRISAVGVIRHSCYPTQCYISWPARAMASPWHWWYTHFVMQNITKVHKNADKWLENIDW